MLHNLFSAQNRWRTIAILALLVVLGGVVYTSAAAFTSASANPSNTVSTGTLTQSNSSPGVAFLTVTQLLPGHTAVGTVTIKNTGSASGAFSVVPSNLADTPGPNGGKLSTVLRLTIMDTSATPAKSVYSGAYNAMPNIDLGKWSANESHTYSFTVTFPEGGTPPSATTGDNAYQGSGTSVTYTWNAVTTS